MKENFKRVIATTVTALILTVPFTAQAASPFNVSQALQQDLSQQQIKLILSDIGNKYKVGEILSPQDSNFVRKYAKIPNQYTNSLSTLAEKSHNYFGNFGDVELTGYTTVDLGFINNSITGSILVRDSEKNYHKKMGSVVELRCFGLFGEGGTKIGLVYSKDYSNEDTNVNNNRNFFQDNFVASVAYFNIDVRGQVDGNSFTTTAREK